MDVCLGRLNLKIRLSRFRATPPLPHSPLSPALATYQCFNVLEHQCRLMSSLSKWICLTAGLTLEVLRSDVITESFCQESGIWNILTEKNIAPGLAHKEMFSLILSYYRRYVLWLGSFRKPSPSHLSSSLPYLSLFFFQRLILKIRLSRRMSRFFFTTLAFISLS
jgi:hypothetical protein